MSLVCEIEMKRYVVKTEEDEQIIPLEDSVAYKMHGSPMFRSMIRYRLGPLGKYVSVDASEFGAPNGKIRMNVVAPSKDDVLEIVNENKNIIEDVYMLFGIKPGYFQVE